MTFSPEFLLDQYFETAFSAPDGIKRLRELILTLAMQGKLVPQDPNDQPARELLREIEAEKQRLIKEGNFKESKLRLGSIEFKKVPFSIPNNWQWCYLDDIAVIARGGSPRPIKSYLTEDSSGWNWIKIGDTDKSSLFITQTKEKIISSGLNKTRIVYPGDLLLSNSMSFGHPFISKIKGCIHDGWLLIRSPDNYVDKIFFCYLFLSGYTKKFFHDSAAGAVVQNLNADKVRALLVPLPPLAEQKRIVEKIESLMTQCDELEKRQQEREQKRILVHTSAVQKLLNAPEEKTFDEAWQFVQQNFGELYAVKENVSELRKAILQLAVMGKLVPQDPHDPPASELLKEIEAEKQRLIKEGKIKKQKPLPEITADEIPYDLPDSWEWCILRQISLAIDYGTSQKTCNDSSKIPVYRMGNILNGRLIDINLKYIDPNIDDLPRLFLQKDDILFNRTNSYELVGKSALYNGEDNIKTFASYLIRIRLEQKNVFPRFVNLVMNAPYFRKTQIEPEITQQCGQANFNGTKLSETLIPLPPLSEQHRIVAKVDALMTLCDQLENQIDQQTTKQTQLLSAVMAGV